MASGLVTLSAEQLRIIRDMVKQKLKPVEILRRLNAHREESSSRAGICNWCSKFSEGPNNSKHTCYLEWSLTVCYEIQKKWFMLFYFTWCTINAQYYTNLLQNVVHKAIWQIWLATVGWEIMNHPPCSLDLASNDFNLFGPMKVHLREQKFQTDELNCSVLNCLLKQ